jgi:glycosyltransferase involved in cell wall biosynthesis
MPKILVVTLKLPLPMTGACEADCATGILQLKKLGFDVRVIAKTVQDQTPERIREVSKKLGAEIIPASFKFDTKASEVQKFKEYFFRFLKNPLILDGAAFEYSDPELKTILASQVIGWKPDLVWFDSTQMWPLYDIVRRNHVPIITRSQNFEPLHFLEEHGFGFLGYLRFLPKLISEIMTVKKSDLIFAITPKEAKIYQKLGAKEVAVLPLRGLWDCLKESRKIKDKEKLNVFYIGSSYDVYHMRKNAEFIIKEIVPRINKLAPDKFCFNFFGSKFPQDFQRYLGVDIIYKGYTRDLDNDLADMDIALIPSFGGAGMKRKIFESLARGIPTITSAEGVAGYPLKEGQEILLASSADEFVQRLIELEDIALRKRLSGNSLKFCSGLFSQKAFDQLVLERINQYVRH